MRRTSRVTGRPLKRVGGLALAAVMVTTAISVSSLGADPIAGLGVNVIWDEGTAASASASGAYACGTTVDVQMTQGLGNSGLGLPIDWATSAATDEAFSNGITPASGVAIYGLYPGNAGTISFSYEVTNPVILVNYIDFGSRMDFETEQITLLDWNTSTPGEQPQVQDDWLALSSDAESPNDGWAVQVAGNFGPTSGPLSFRYEAINPSTVGFSVALPSGTECEPPAPPPPPSPTPEPTPEPTPQPTPVPVSPRFAG
jgi:hypothetical protein